MNKLLHHIGMIIRIILTGVSEYGKEEGICDYRGQGR